MEERKGPTGSFLGEDSFRGKDFLFLISEILLFKKAQMFSIKIPLVSIKICGNKETFRDRE